MDKHFIKNLEITKFKCFSDFEIKDFGRVNLISGKNNIGKTALMEAIYINCYSKNIDTLFTAITNIQFKRDLLEYVRKDVKKEDIVKSFENIKNYSSKSNINEMEYFFLNKDGKKEYKFKINDKDLALNVNEFSYHNENISNIDYVATKGISNDALKLVYTKLQRIDKEDELNKYINEFDNSIEKFKLFDKSPECKLKGEGEYRKINEFGDGLKNYIAIICALYASTNGYLFIDEIESGVYYTQLDKLWEIILEISKKQNVQVFATTHSKECIESFNRVSKRLEDNEIKFIELFKHDNKIESIILDNEMLDYQLNQNHEVR